MPPDDRPIDQVTKGSTKLPGAKPLIRKEDQSRLDQEGEICGGAEQPDEPQVEQQRRQNQAKL